MWEEIDMTVSETIRLIKSYEEEVKNYLIYMDKINRTLMSNIAFVNEIKIQMTLDDVLKKRLIHLGNRSNGLVIQKYFPDIFVEENKKVR